MIILAWSSYTLTPVRGLVGYVSRTTTSESLTVFGSSLSSIIISFVLSSWLTTMHTLRHINIKPKMTLRAWLTYFINGRHDFLGLFTSHFNSKMTNVQIYVYQERRTHECTYQNFHSKLMAYTQHHNTQIYAHLLKISNIVKPYLGITHQTYQTTLRHFIHIQISNALTLLRTNIHPSKAYFTPFSHYKGEIIIYKHAWKYHLAHSKAHHHRTLL